MPGDRCCAKRGPGDAGEIPAHVLAKRGKVDGAYHHEGGVIGPIPRLIPGAHGIQAHVVQVCRVAKRRRGIRAAAVSKRYVPFSCLLCRSVFDFESALVFDRFDCPFHVCLAKGCARHGIRHYFECNRQSCRG